MGEAQPQAAVPQDEPYEVKTALHLLEVVEAVVRTVGLRVEGLVTWGRGRGGEGRGGEGRGGEGRGGEGRGGEGKGGEGRGREGEGTGPDRGLVVRACVCACVSSLFLAALTTSMYSCRFLMTSARMRYSLSMCCRTCVR